jgi:uncharacterized protein YbjT (DUF2867 family)
VEPPRCIAVTGGTGFTGGFVLRELRRVCPDVRIRCLVRRDSNRARLHSLDVEAVEGDLHDSGSVARAFESLFAAIRASSLRRGLFVSTTAILTRLPVASRASRERGEQLVRESRLDWTIVRPTMIYGTPADRNIARLIRFVEHSPVIPVIAPDALQQPVHVEDVAGAIVACLMTPSSIGRTYTLSGREPLTFESLVRETVRATGRRRVVVRLPFAPMLRAVQVYNAIAPSPRIKVEQVLRLREHKAFDYSAAARDFGFSPRSFAEGLRDEVRALRERAGA